MTESAPRPPRDLAFWVATFFGSGLAPGMPGTVGSLASLLVWAPLVWFEVPWWVRLVAAVAFFAIGVPATARTAKALGKDDPKEVVIDEVVGQGLALLLAASSVLSLVVGFALFRFFDILKPWPVSWADRRHDAVGVMLDDVLAGLYALALLTAAERWLFVLLPG